MQALFTLPVEQRVLRAAGSNTGRSLDSLAQLVRDIYVLERRVVDEDPTFGIHPIAHWDGGVTLSGVQRANIWLKLASFFILNQFDAVQFIRAQFRISAKRRPLPNEFLSPAAVERYQQFLKSGPEAKRLELRSSVESLQMALAHAQGFTRLSPRQQAVAAISGDTLQATPLFRYCLAWAMALPELLPVYHEPALGHYVFSHQFYDEAWGDVVPAELRREAVELRAMLAS
jgi:hypothetical protein